MPGISFYLAGLANLCASNFGGLKNYIALATAQPVTKKIAQLNIARLVNGQPRGFLHNIKFCFDSDRSITCSSSKSMGRSALSSSSAFTSYSESEMIDIEATRLSVMDDALIKSDEEIFSKYSTIASHFKLSKRGDMLKAKERSSKISPVTLHQIICAAHRSLDEGKQAFVTAQGNQFLLSKQQNDLKVFQFTDIELGKGGFGRVTKAVDLSTRTLMPLAAKSALDFPAARKDVRQERELLLWLHADAMANGTFQRGLQRPPQVVFDACKDDFYKAENDFIDLDSSECHKKLVGYLAPLYDSSLFEHSFKSMKLADRIDCVHQLLCGLRYCSDKKNVRLGDIKPENCLIKKWTDDQGESRFECVLSDFGGACVIEGEAFADWGTYTSSYCMQADENDFKQWKDQLQDPSLSEAAKEEIREKIAALFKARDVYALSFVIKKIFPISKSIPKGFAAELQQLIDRMSHAAHQQRITIEEALTEFEKIAKPYHVAP